MFSRRKAEKPSDLETYYDGVRAAIAAAESTRIKHQTHLEGIAVGEAVDAMKEIIADGPKCKTCKRPLGSNHETKVVDKGYDYFYVSMCGRRDPIEIGDC